jgi:hypothetical protein
MTQSRLIQVPFLIPPKVDGRPVAAQVLLPNTIFVLPAYAKDVRLIAHELTHVDQINRLGLARYWFRYLRLLKKHGYQDHPMEIEARGMERNPAQLARARRLIEGE